MGTVPGVWAPDAFLTYMSAMFPRLVLNEAGAVCSNNLLALRLQGVPQACRSAFASAFYNSATLLSAERIGRRYGGGVLKLEPSEADRILVPSPALIQEAPNLKGLLAGVDRALRDRAPMQAVEAVDNVFLRRTAALSASEAAALRSSFDRRRHDRMGTKPPRSHSPTVS